MKTRTIFALTIAMANSTFAQQVLCCAGTVRYPSGAPAAGVQVEYYPGHHPGAGSYAEVKTDANGRYDIIGQKGRPDFWGGITETNCIMARDVKRNLAAIQEFHVATTNVDLILQPAITFSGSVKDLAGAPIAGARLGLGFQASGQGNLLEAQPIKVNDLGQFSIPALPQGRTYSVWGITAKGYGSGYAWLEANDTRTNHYEFPTFVLLHADRKIAGRVLNDAGKPLAGARVYFMGNEQPPGFLFTNTATELNFTNTDSDGKFCFDTVCEAPLRVNAVYNDPHDRSIIMTLKDGVGMPAHAGDTNIIIRLQSPNK